ARAPDPGRDQRNHAADCFAQADRGRAMTDAPVAEGDLIARKEGSVGVIRLNRPKAINAVTLEMFHDIDRALDAFEKDPAVAVILLEGAGERGLCAGGDIRSLWESSKVKAISARSCGGRNTSSTPASRNSRSHTSPSWTAS